jgi:hypothetical protein
MRMRDVPSVCHVICASEESSGGPQKLEQTVSGRRAGRHQGKGDVPGAQPRLHMAQLPRRVRQLRPGGYSSAAGRAGGAFVSVRAGGAQEARAAQRQGRGRAGVKNNRGWPRGAARAHAGARRHPESQRGPAGRQRRAPAGRRQPCPRNRPPPGQAAHCSERLRASICCSFPLTSSREARCLPSAASAAALIWGGAEGGRRQSVGRKPPRRIGVAVWGRGGTAREGARARAPPGAATPRERGAPTPGWGAAPPHLRRLRQRGRAQQRQQRRALGLQQRRQLAALGRQLGALQAQRRGAVADGARAVALLGGRGRGAQPGRRAIRCGVLFRQGAGCPTAARA